ncbi:hypothetical protein LJC10_06135 [Selenomonadales bacterium OttesenSCG-928-I06]|nr:hypothetical protein [Selenomonadales bacterium OttesenSCG-928-I06]
MAKFKINTNTYKESAINRTIRIKGECFDKIMDLSAKNHVSFNKIINQCIEYALKNLEEDNSSESKND